MFLAPFEIGYNEGQISPGTGGWTVITACGELDELADI